MIQGKRWHWSTQNPYNGHRCVLCDAQRGFKHPNPTIFGVRGTGATGRWWNQSKIRFRLLLRLRAKAYKLNKKAGKT